RPLRGRDPPPDRPGRNRRAERRDRRLGSASERRPRRVPRSDRHPQGDRSALEEGGLRGRRGVDRPGLVSLQGAATMAAVQRLAHPGWCRNLVGAARIEPGERVLVLVDEPLAEEGSQLLAAVKDAGAEPRLELWAGKRPLPDAPAAVKEAARESKLLLFLAQAPRGDEASARFEASEVILEHGGRGIFLGFVDGDLLRRAPP